jgi:hypothetical protein
MRFLGWLFIAAGVLMCLTVFLFMPGIACVIAGALLCIAGRKSRPAGETGPYRNTSSPDRCPSCGAEADVHVLGCKNSRPTSK